MFEHLLLLNAIVLGMAVLRLLRRLDSGQRLYLLVVVAQLAVTLAAMVQRDAGDRYLGIVVVGFTTLTVGIPWVLEGMSRRAFARGQLAWAVRLAGMRSMLMPGAGLSRQQQVLEGLALLERQGVDEALVYFRNLAGQVDDGGELAVIHEQIVSMLFYDQRWNEGIAHYEGQFHVGYAAMRPVLALGLLRAYGEAGRLDNAAGLLRALEDGPLGADPGAAELLSQARLTFLAYAGASSYVDEAVGGHCKSLGISQASGALFRGIALARAGEADRAVTELRRVRALAGPRDERVVRASKNAIDKIEDEGAPPSVEPELSRYAQVVGERLRRFLHTERLPQRRGPVFVTHLVVFGLVLGYAAAQLVGARGAGLLRVGGFTSELLYAGSWGRVFTAGFVQIDLIGLLLDIYAIWLGGHVVERLLGSARLGLIALWGSVVGIVVAGQFGGPADIVIGGSLMAAAVCVAALWTLLPRRTPGLAARARRSLGFTLALLLGAQLLEALPDSFGIVVSPFALLAAAVVATVFAGVLPVSLPKPVNVLLGILALATAAAGGAGVVTVAREDVESFALVHRDRTVNVGDAASVSVPLNFESVEAGPRGPLPLPVYDGLIDTQARRTGALVEFVAAPAPAEDSDAEAVASGSVLFRLDDGVLAREASVRAQGEPPPLFVQRLDASLERDAWRSYLVQRNGDDVARVVERPLADGSIVALVAAPPESLELAPVLYASILAEATPVED